MGGGGKGGGDKPEIDPRVAQMAQDAVFKPYTLTTGVGSTEYDKENNAWSTTLDPTLQGIQQAGYGGVSGLMSQIPEAYGREAAQFGFDTNLAGRTSDIFREQSALLEPSFAQQRQQLQSDLFGSGRMGLMLAGEAAGAGAGGMVSPDAFGLGRAQSETLANLAAQSRQQALGEQLQGYNIEQGIFGINEALEQQRAQNLLAGTTGLFGLGSAISDTEASLLQLGLATEGARGASYAQAAGALSAGQKAAGEAAKAANSGGGGKGLLGTVGSAAASAAATQGVKSYFASKAAASAAASAAAAAPVSDIRLKQNIVKIGKYNSGLNMYTWDWNKEGKKVAHPDQPTVGVMAQEAMLVFPEAVMKGDDGYLRVDYGRIS